MGRGKGKRGKKFLTKFKQKRTIANSLAVNSKMGGKTDIGCSFAKKKNQDWEGAGRF